MGLYISLMRFTDKGLGCLHESKQRLEQSQARTEALGGRSRAFFATLGVYDFVQVFEMPDNDTMMEYALTARRDGYVDPVILPAFETDSYSAILNRMKSKEGA